MLVVVDETQLTNACCCDLKKTSEHLIFCKVLKSAKPCGWYRVRLHSLRSDLEGNTTLCSVCQRATPVTAKQLLNHLTEMATFILL